MAKGMYERRARMGGNLLHPISGRRRRIKERVGIHSGAGKRGVKIAPGGYGSRSFQSGENAPADSFLKLRRAISRICQRI
jgi:hypothetical protein